MIERLILAKDCDCQGCGCPLMCGEVAYRNDATGTIGHSRECCTDAVGELLDHHERALFLAGFDLNLIGGVR